MAGSLRRSAPRDDANPSAAMRPMAFLFRRVAALDDDELDLAAAVEAMRRRVLVGLRMKAADRLVEGRELDHHEAGKRLRAFKDLEPAAAAQHRAVMRPHELRNAIGVALVFLGVGNPGPGAPVSPHGRLLLRT